MTWLEDPTKTRPPGKPLRESPETRRFAQQLYEAGELLRVIVERLDTERDVCVTPEAIQWWAKREGWDPSGRHPGYRLRSLRGAATKRAGAEPVTEDEWAARLKVLVRRCPCGGIIHPAHPGEHRCGYTREGT